MTETYTNPGCVIFLIDESAAMDLPIQEELPHLQPGQSPKPRAANVANAINSWIRRASETADCDVAILGYQTADDGAARVFNRLPGDFAEREWASLAELKANPLREEIRTQRTPNPAGFGPPIENEITVPVWYEAEPAGKAPQVAAFDACRELVQRWDREQSTGSAPAVVVHIFASISTDGNPHKAISELREWQGVGGQPVVLQVHLSSAKLVPSTVYPSNRYYLPPGAMKDLFDRSSPLSETQRHTLTRWNVATNAGAVAMLYNAKMPDVAQALKLIEEDVKAWPSRAMELSSADLISGEPSGGIPLADDATSTLPLPDEDNASAADSETLPIDHWTDNEPLVDLAEEQADTEEPTLAVSQRQWNDEALLILLCDRSVSDPYVASDSAAWPKLQLRANTLLGEAAKNAAGQLDVALITYGVDALGEADVRSAFEGPLTGQTIVKDVELAGGALRVDETWEQVPDGTGGLTSIPVQQHIFVEQEPSAPATTAAAIQRTTEIINEWSADHPDACLPPVVLHLTRGPADQDEYRQYAEPMTQITTPAGSVLLYHLVLTEQPHKSVSYPADHEELEWPGLKGLFDLSSPLLGRETLADAKPGLVSAESRGLVVNARFDRLWDGIRAAFTNSVDATPAE